MELSLRPQFGLFCSLKSSLHTRLAGSDWVAQFPLVMLGVRSSPKDESGLSPAEAVYGSTLSLPSEFLEHSEFPPESLLRNIEKTVLGFYGPPWHHMIPQPKPQPLPRALIDTEFAFFCDDTSKPLLSPLYRGPDRVLRRSETFFILQIGDKSDSVSVD